MERRILIWGAGKIGRGFVADLFDEAGWALTFVDADDNMVKSLRERGGYTVVKLPEEGPEEQREIAGFEVLSISERERIDERLLSVPLAAVVVFPAIFDAVAAELARGIERRAAERPEAPLDILLCANTAHPRELFYPILREKLSRSGEHFLDEKVGLIETVILRIGIPPEPHYLEQDPNIVVTNGYPVMPVDKSAFKGGLPEVPGLRFSERIGAEEIRKIYCYNMAHAALAYAGYRKGYRYVSEAARDPEVAEEVEGALEESARALAAEYSFSEAEMAEYTSEIVAYLGNPALPDTVARVGGDPKRKAGPEDRLIGPARLCEKHDIEPRYLLRTVGRAFLFDPPEDKGASELQRELKLYGFSEAALRTCGLEPEEELGRIAREEFERLLETELPSPGAGSAPASAAAASAASLPPEAVVAGHVCLDITPRFGTTADGSLDEILHPGALVDMDGIVISPGGAVTNVGINLANLGVRTSLVALTGDDEFGSILRSSLGDHGDVSGIRSTSEKATSYTVVLAPPGRDRVFLHDTGANDLFAAGDIDYDALEGVRLLHFGYPPAMESMYVDEGAELEELLRRAKERGVTVSLDLSLPDPASAAGKAPWQRILERALPYVDIFLPSLEEIAFMLDEELYHRLLPGQEARTGGGIEPAETGPPYTLADLSRLGAQLLRRGVAVAGIKCGVDGFFVGTGSAERISAAGRGAPDPELWSDRELFSNSYELEKVASATGAGDASIAGFLAGCLAGEPPETAISLACAAGGATTTVYDTASGINGYRELKDAFVTRGRKTSRLTPEKPWAFDSETEVWSRPRTRKEQQR